ncbi:hypothetical protein [Candidatus Leptofilum sp.]|uniref:hypothetical protein n=1 Tax=Candidatus Leptofilum sp. TaxID=3241576 RepID=UPI003B5D0043
MKKNTPLLNDAQTKEANETNKPLWQKPQLKKLQISLDTALFGGSNADMTRGTTI